MSVRASQQSCSQDPADACNADSAQLKSFDICLERTKPGEVCFSERCALLIFSNVPSYAGGANPWAWSKKKCLSNPPPSLAWPENVKQDSGDQKIELLSWSSALGAGLDAATSNMRLPGRGKAKRVLSGQGPFVATFKDPSIAHYKNKEGRVYFQIDGEFFVAVKPAKMQVSHLRTVHVLKNVESQAKTGCCC